MASLETLAGFLLNGVVLAAILALAAIGLSLVYGILRLSNFAHGDLLTLGAYTAYLFNVVHPDRAPAAAFLVAAVMGSLVVVDVAAKRGWLAPAERASLLVGAVVLAASPQLGPLVPGPLGGAFLTPTLLAVAAVPLFNLALDRLVWRRLRAQKATVVTLIITSIGVALALRHALMLEFGGDIQTFDQAPRPPLRLAGSLIITQVQLWIVLVAGLVILGVHLFLKYTRVGKSLRAVADDQELARVAGIDVDRMIAYVWVLGGAMAGLAGVMLALNVNVNPNLGWNFLLPMFAAVILGGIGSAYGAMLGALVIAVAMEVSVAWLPDYRMAVGFTILILTMLVRPNGLLGVKR